MRGCPHRFISPGSLRHELPCHAGANPGFCVCVMSHLRCILPASKPNPCRRLSNNLISCEPVARSLFSQRGLPRQPNSECAPKKTCTLGGFISSSVRIRRLVVADPTLLH